MHTTIYPESSSRSPENLRTLLKYYFYKPDNSTWYNTIHPRLACSRWVTTMWVNRPLQVSQLGQLTFHPSGVDKWVEGLISGFVPGGAIWWVLARYRPSGSDVSSTLAPSVSGSLLGYTWYLVVTVLRDSIGISLLSWWQLVVVERSVLSIIKRIIIIIIKTFVCNKL